MSNENRGIMEGHHNSKKIHSITVEIGDTPMIFESGRIAKQAAGSIVTRWGDSVTLTTVCAASTPRVGIDFFPLTCEYIEKSYAAGKIPGGYLKREARPGTDEILNARITDRSIRPLFPDGYRNEVQVITTVLSHDGSHNTDVMALCAASMALHISEIPFAEESGPIAGVRVARINGSLVFNPTEGQIAKSDIDMLISSSKDAVMMVEGGADQVPEADLLEALFAAQEQGCKIIDACHEMRKEVGKEKISFTAPVVDTALEAQVREIASSRGLVEAVQLKEKKARYGTIDSVKVETMAAIEEIMGDDFAEKKKEISGYFMGFKSHLMRTRTAKERIRIDGRGMEDIRPIDCEVSVLPRSHGSSLFTRGETQGLVTTTLGTSDDEKREDDLMGDHRRTFMLHYNFPPFSVGEARGLRGTSRREIGHGALAQTAVAGIIPSKEDFPYTIRVVSEILESNGSSSMATVCGATMSMLDAGVPLKAPIAGIAMGLVKEGDDVAILSDILGDEDHIGDMDFKICGSDKGVTAIQMDIKIAGLSKDIFADALEQARAGRMHILGLMNEAIGTNRAEVAEFAPSFIDMRINPEKIRDIIGPGGKTIRDIVARSNAKVDVEDNGNVRIYGVGKKSVETAKKIIEDLTREAEVNRIYKALVRKVVDFGAFAQIFPGCDGLIHISELAEKRVKNVSDIIEEGDEVLVKVLSIDRDGKIRLSRRQAIGKEVGTIDI